MVRRTLLVHVINSQKLPVYHSFFKGLKLKTCFLVLLAMMTLQGLAQSDRKIDSLKSLMVRRNGLDRYDVLYELVFGYLGKEDYQQSLRYVSEANEIAYEFGDSLRIVKTGRITGQLLRRLDRPADAIVELKKVLPISRRNKNFAEDYGDILNALAVCYTLQTNYDKALQYHFEGLVLREKEGNGESIGITLTNIGLVYYKLKNFENALEYYKRVLDQPVNFKDRLLINIGLCYNELGDYSAAIKFIDDGFKSCAPKCNDNTILNGEFGLGVSLFSLAKPNDAERHFLTSYNLAKKQNDKRFQIENLIYLARIKNDYRLHDEARKLLVQAESIASETGYNELMINIYKEYSELYVQTEDYKNVSFYQAKYIALRDSIFNEELIKNLTKVQTDYEERENLRTIADKDAVLALKEETLKRQRTENLFYGAVSLMVFALAVLMLLLFRLTRRANERLESRVDERTKELNDSNDALKKVNGEM